MPQRRIPSPQDMTERPPPHTGLPFLLCYPATCLLRRILRRVWRLNYANNWICTINPNNSVTMLYEWGRRRSGMIYECWKPTYDFGCRIAGIGDRHRPAITGPPPGD